MEMNGRRGGRKSAGDATSAPSAHARLRDFSRSLPMSLLRAREAVMLQFRPKLHHFGMTEQQWRVLRALTAIESIEVMALAEVTFLLPPSLSRILKDLDERRLIVRSTSETDLRRSLVSISDQGRRLIDQAGAYSETIYAEISRRYGARKLALLRDMLRDLETALAKPIATGELPDAALQHGPARRRGRPRKIASDQRGAPVAGRK